MIGLFQENGPCRITNDTSSVTLNPYSWNNEANVLYIDQPVGAGFSNGKLNVGTSDEAAVDVWTFMQIFLSDHRFAKYSWQKLAIWTESYVSICSIVKLCFYVYLSDMVVTMDQPSQGECFLETTITSPILIS